MSKKTKKQIKKLVDKKCYFCDENDYELLCVHRIRYDLPKNQNKYTEGNMITVCIKHHNMIHNKEIKIDKFYTTTLGKNILHYWYHDMEFWN